MNCTSPSTTSKCWSDAGPITISGIPPYLTILKTANPSPAVAGSILTYKVIVNNDGPSAATAVTITDTLPAAVTYQSATCDKAYTITQSSGVVNCILTNALAAGTSATLTINVLVSSTVAGTLRNIAVADSAETTPISYTLDTPVVKPASLTIIKTASISPAVSGSPLTYTLTVTNTGGSSATGVTIADTLPSNVTYLSASCNRTATITHNSGIVSCILANSLAAGASVNLTINVLVSASATGKLHNLAIADCTETAPVQFVLETPVVKPASLAIIKTASISPAVAGGTLSYAITVTNTGGRPATSVNITDTLPSNVTYQSATCDRQATITYSSGTVACLLAQPLPPGIKAILTIEVSVSPSALGMLHNFAFADSTETDSVECSLETPVVQPARLNIVKTASKSPAIAGSSLNYTLTVTNTGGLPATSVNITDTLPGGVSYHSAICSLPSTITENGGVITCRLANPLAPGSSATLEIEVLASATASGSLHNLAAANSSETTPVQFTIDTPVVKSVHLSIIKTASRSPAVAGQEINYTIAVKNSGPSEASSVTINDTLPANVTYISSSCDLPASITESGGAISCALSDHLAPGAGANLTIEVLVSPTASGMLHNPAQADCSESAPVQYTLETPVVQPARLDIVKTASESPATADGTLNYTITVSNTGDLPAGNVTINDTLPGNATYQNAFCSLPSTITEDDGVVTCRLTNPLAPAGFATLTIEALVSPSASGSLHNLAAANSTETDPVQFYLDTPVVRSVHLNIIKTASKSPAVAGQEMNYIIVVRNSGPSAASSITINDELPVSVTYISSSCNLSASITENDGIIRCALSGPLAPGASANLTIKVRVSPAASETLHNLAKADSEETDPIEYPLDTPVIKPARLNIVKSAPSPAIVGAFFNYTLTVINTGGLPAGNVAIHDALPVEVIFQSASCDLPSTISVDNSEVSCALANPLPPGAAAILTIRVQVIQSTSGFLHNVASALSSDTEPVEYALDTPVTDSPMLSIVKTANPSPAIAGSLLTYSVIVGNAASFPLRACSKIT